MKNLTLILALLITTTQAKTYTPAYGETFLGVALKHGLTYSQLQKLNPNINPERMQAGQQLEIGNAKQQKKTTTPNNPPTPTTTKTIVVEREFDIVMQNVDVIQVNGKNYIIKGLEWSGQQKKLSNPKFSCVHIPTTGKDGKIYTMLCMPIKKLNGWLFSINPEKVKAEIRDIVIAYQEECFAVLYDYWHNGKAINPRFEKISDQQAHQLKTMVEKRCKNNKEHE